MRYPSTTATEQTRITVVPDFSRPVTIEEAVALIAADFPVMSDARLAAMLMNMHLDGQTPLGAALEPELRAELVRRRAVRTMLDFD
jgi:hypothetical protein